MSTLFDIVTVISFVGLVAAFFLWTDRETRTLLHLSISGVVLAVANQIGNAGNSMFAVVLILAAIGYAILVTWRSAS